MSDELLLRIVTDPGVIANPYPLLSELRETAPVHKLGFADFWILTRFEDCRAALRDQRLGNPEPGDDVPTLIVGSSRDPDGPRSLLSLNPPDHTRIRSLVSRAFTPRRVERLRPAVEAMTDGLLDAVAEAGQCDLVEALAFPLPANVISELVGFPSPTATGSGRWCRTWPPRSNPTGSPRRPGRPRSRERRSRRTSAT